MIPVTILAALTCWAAETAPLPPAAELPRVYLDTTYTPGTGKTISVRAGDNLQTALDQARPGDTVALEAGATFTGNFVLRKRDGTGWIIIRSSAPDSALPPPGTRMTPSYSGRLPKIVSPNSMPAVATAPSAHHYRLVGLEISVAPTVKLNYDLMTLGDGSAAQASLDQVPTDLIIDRCYIHGNPNQDAKRGIALNSARTAIVDSYLSEIHGLGLETQAICGWNGPGPYRIVNNYLEAATENIMFGGARAGIPDLVPSDIEVRRNHFFKPRSWRKEDPSFAGRPWAVKNLFELKNARRVLVEGNLLEQCWAHAQTGFAVLFTVRTEDGAMPWAVVEDVTFAHNIVRHCGSGVNILGRDDNKLGKTHRIVIRDNVFDDISGERWGGDGRLFQILSATENLVIDHNTCSDSRDLWVPVTMTQAALACIHPGLSQLYLALVALVGPSRAWTRVSYAAIRSTTAAHDGVPMGRSQIARALRMAADLELITRRRHGQAIYVRLSIHTRFGQRQQRSLDLS